MKFKNDNTKECYQCDKTIYPGESYYKFKHNDYCSEQCLGKAMVAEHYDEVEECYLMTAQDKEDEYGDILYHQIKDEVVLLHRCVQKGEEQDE